MPKGERLSAVAKRRRHDANISSTNGVNSPPTHGQPQSPGRVPSHTNVSIAAISAPSTSEALEPDDNEFAALVDIDIVQFSNYREIERLNAEGIVIRLSKGQKCLISGGYSLWVKAGAIELFGARLEATSRVHHVHSAAAYEVPSIAALSNTAEFEVHTRSDEILPWAGQSMFYWTPVGSNDIFYVSYFVHGYSISISGTPPTVSQLDASLANEVIYRIYHRSDQSSVALTPTVLFCGRQSPGTNMLMLGVINRMVTLGPLKKDKSFGPSVLLLDLDSDLPTFGPPGTVSLISVNRPLLGPPFACPTTNQYDENVQGDTITVHHMDWQQHGPVDIPHLTTLIALARASLPQGGRRIPLLIKANEWLERIDMSQAQAQSLAKILVPTSVVRFGSENASNSGQLGELIATQIDACELTSFPTPNSKDPALHIQHEMALQSYFHFRGYRLSRPRWNSLPLTLDRQSVVSLSYGSNSALISKISLPGLDVDPYDLFDVLRGCIVGIVVQDLVSAMGTKDMEVQTAPQPHQNNQQTRAVGGTSSPFIGFGIIVGLSEGETEVRMITPISPCVFEYHHEHDHKVELIAQKADPNGRFDTAWAQLEDEATISQGRPTKTVYRHGLDPR